MSWSRFKPLIKIFVSNCTPKNYYLPKTSYSCNQILYNTCKRNYCVQISGNNSEEYYDKVLKELSKGDEETEKKLQLIMMELEVMRQDAHRVPENVFLKTQYWEHLLTLPSRSSRQKYLAYLWQIEKKKEKSKMKKEAKNEAFQEVLKEREIKKNSNENSDEMEYGLIKNSMFLRIYDSSMNKFYNSRLAQAAQFGEKLIIDCSYGEHMNHLESKNAANQLTYLFADNRIHKDPFDLHLCNCDFESITIKQLMRNIPSTKEPWFPLNMHSQSYLNLFPKDKLVYLTPHCRNEMTHFDPDAYYIVGCMVDKVKSEPLSLAKAKEQNIKMSKFPLDRYLQWGSGSGKSLTINQVVNILLDLKISNDWDYALRHVPRRKIDHNMEKIRSKGSFKVITEYRNDNNQSFTNKNDADKTKERPQNRTPTNFYKRKVFTTKSLFDKDF